MLDEINSKTTGFVLTMLIYAIFMQIKLYMS